MAARLTLNPHEYKTKAGRNVLVRVTPYIRLCDGNGPPVFVQNGCFFSEGGPQLTELPPWLPEALKHLSPAARKEVGLEAVPLPNSETREAGSKQKRHGGGWPKGRKKGPDGKAAPPVEAIPEAANDNFEDESD